MTSQIDPEDLYKAAYRETQGQPVDAEPRAWDGYAHAVASSSELAGTEWETNDQPVGAMGRACTCHPDDSPPVPCAKKYAFSECKSSTLAEKDARIAELLAADEVRARVISRLTIERDEAHAECEGLRAALEAAKNWLEYDNSPMGEAEEAAYWRLRARIDATLSQKETGDE